MTKEKKVLEKDIQRAICDWLHEQGYFFWRQNNVPIFGRSNDGVKRFRAMPKYTPKGLPDIIVLHAGKFIGFEVKRAGMPLRDEQAEMGRLITKNGGDYYVVTSWEEVRDLLTFKPIAIPLSEKTPPVL